MSRRVFVFCIGLLALAAAYTIASAWVTVGRIDRLHVAGNAAAQSQQVLSALHAFATAAVDVQASARGYALTGNEAYLQPLEAARRQAPLRLDELRDLLRDDAKQLARVERLTPLLAETLSVAEHDIAQKRSAPAEPLAPRTGPRPREAVDEIRRIVEDIESDERQDLAARKSAWQQELERARTTEAISALSSLTVITLSLWALLRLRRTETPAAAHAPASSAPAPPVAAPAIDFDALIDDVLRRAAMLAASYPAAAPERVRIDALREAIEATRAGMAPTEALDVLATLGLAPTLAALARVVRERAHCTVRESIDATAPPVPPPHVALLMRAAAWALDVLCAQDAAEIGVGLAHDDAHVVLRVESPLLAATPLRDDDAARAQALARELALAGGSWQWSAGDTGQGLIVTVPTPARIADDTHEPASAPA